MYIEASAVSIRLRLDHGSAALSFVGLIDAGVNVATRPGPFPCCVVEIANFLRSSSGKQPQSRRTARSQLKYRKQPHAK
jgi:hypothetical protein